MPATRSPRTATATTVDTVDTGSTDAGSVDVDDVAAGLRLSTTRLARRLRAEADMGLTPSLLSALAVVHVHGPLTLGSLAQLEGIAPPTVTKIVGKLQDQGLVERTTDSADRRVCRVSTTEQGDALLARSRARKTAWLAARLAALDADELATLARASHIIESLLELDRTAPPDPAAGGGSA